MDGQSERPGRTVPVDGEGLRARHPRQWAQKGKSRPGGLLRECAAGGGL